MTNDPRTLPYGDLWPNLGLLFTYLMMLADIFVTRWGIWYYGQSEGNKVMAWFTKTAFRTFLDATVRLPIVFLMGQLLVWGGVFDNAHWYFPFFFGVPFVVLVIRNLLKIRAVIKAGGWKK